MIRTACTLLLPAESFSGHPCCDCSAPVDVVRVAGYPDFYPRRCPSCEVIREERERVSREERERRLLGVGRRFLSSSFTNLHEPLPPLSVLETCKLFAATCLCGHGRGLYLWSKTNGTGKTHLAAAIALQAGDGLFVATSDLLDALRDSYSTGDNCLLYERAVQARLLVLDDLGAERTTDWTTSRLYALLNRRYNACAATVFTSNYSPEHLEPSVGARIVSRILGTCTVLHLAGPDHRRLQLT